MHLSRTESGRPSIVLRTAHHPFAFMIVGGGLWAAGVISTTGIWPYVSLIGMYPAVWLYPAMLFHGTKECRFCTATPLRNGADLARQRTVSLWLFHRVFTGWIAIVLFVGTWVGLLILITSTYRYAWTLSAFTITIDLITGYLLLVHMALRPWCPWCHKRAALTLPAANSAPDPDYLSG